MNYEVRFYMDNTYEVWEKQTIEWTVIDGCTTNKKWVSVFKGSLSDCEAYIRLREGGYL